MDAGDDAVTLNERFKWVATLSAGSLDVDGLDAAEVVLSSLDATTQTTLARALGAAAERDFPLEPLWLLFPTTRPARDVRTLGLTKRGENVLLANGNTTLGQCLELSITDLGRLRNTGQLTVADIVMRLALAALRDTPGVASLAPDVRSSTASSGNNGADVESERDSPALVHFLEELRQISRLLGALGKDDRSPLTGLDEAEQIEPVRLTLERLFSTTASDLFPGETSSGTLADTLEAAVATFSEREVVILRERFFADQPATLEDLAQRFGLTRERVRQIGSRVIAQVAEVLHGDDLVGQAAAVIRARITQTIPLENLLDEFPPLRETVSTLNQPVWRVLDRLDETYEIADGWVASPTVAAAVTRFRNELEAHAGRHKLVPVSDVRAARPGEWITASRSNLRRWLRYCEMEALEGYVMVGKGSMLERAVAVLAATAEPLTAEVIHDRIGIDRSIQSLKNQMSTDDRFVRVGRNAWGLAEWGMSGYTSIREAIRATLEATGGAAELAGLAESVSAAYGVQRGSVIAYATTYPFESRQGIVRLAPNAKGATKTPAETRRMYRRGADWLFRTVLTHDHVRGSGSLMPPGFAHVLELVEGEATGLPSPVGEQSFYWTGMQPSIGSVKSLVELRELAEGDEVFFVLTASGSFDLEACRKSDGGPRDRILAAIGTGEGVEIDDLLAHVGAAVGSPGEATVEAVRRWLLSRGERDLALWVEPALAPSGD